MDQSTGTGSSSLSVCELPCSHLGLDARAIPTGHVPAQLGLTGFDPDVQPWL